MRHLLCADVATWGAGRGREKEGEALVAQV